MKKLLQIGITTTASLIVTILLLNFVYLSGYIDFYKAELLAYNQADDLLGHVNKKTILIMGDSFTAGNNNYPGILRNISPNYRIINSGISGSGIIQASTIAKTRIKTFKPDIFIYQIYVGNDLMDITYPTNWSAISFARNIYWSAANHIRIFSYINYKLGQLNASINRGHKKRTRDKNELFSIEKFTAREKIYNVADNKLIENSILLKGSRKNDADLLFSKIEEIFQLLPSHTRKYVLIVPHASQINQDYLNRTILIGAKFTNPNHILKKEYPFINRIKEIFPDANILNALGALRNAENKGLKVYYPNDGHLNKNGQIILADYVAMHL